jgi:hypothetical protein
MVDKRSNAMREGDGSSMSNHGGSVDSMDSSWNNRGMDSVSNSWGMVDSVSNSWSMVDSMSNSWGVVDSMGNSWSMMSNNWSMVGSMMSDNWSSMNSMVSRMSNDWSSVGNMSSMRMGNWWRNRSVVSHWVDSMMGRWRWQRFAILINWNWLGQEWVEERISVESIELGSFIAVHSVPGLTSEEMLVKESSIGTNESSTMWSMSSILTDTVGLTA